MEEAWKEDGLLPANALRGVQVGVSVSSSPDLERLGLLESHFRLALGEIGRCILVSGGDLTYGGHLEEDGYTAFLIHELHRHARRNRPLHICLAWSEHRKMSLGRLEEQRKLLGLYGDITCLDPDGNAVIPTNGREERPAPEVDDITRVRGLTAMRRYVTERTQARILIGGRREGFQGEMPGLVEEVILALKAGRSVYLAGGFGGVTLDVIKALGIDDVAWLPELPNAAERDPRLIKSLSIVAEMRSRDSWRGLQNGLNEEENHKLASTHRPSEVAALVSLGLGRIQHGSMKLRDTHFGDTP